MTTKANNSQYDSRDKIQDLQIQDLIYYKSVLWLVTQIFLIALFTFATTIVYDVWMTAEIWDCQNEFAAQLEVFFISDYL